jgi:hypothetical protein
MNEFYTYAFLREDKTPYYIGKGKGKRAWKKRRKGVAPPRDASRILILKKGLSEENSFRHEVYMIAVFGRKNLGTGVLLNKTDGGDGISGMIHSEEHKRKNSESHRGKVLPEEVKRKIREAGSGSKNPNYGKKWWHNPDSGETEFSVECPQEGWVKGQSKEHREKISNSHKGQKRSDSHKENNSKSKVGRRWWHNPESGKTRVLSYDPGPGWEMGRK